MRQIQGGIEQNISQSSSVQQEDKWKVYSKQLEAYKHLPIQDKINHIVLKISKQTQGTKQAFPLYQIFSELYPLLEDLENFKAALSDDQTKTLYLKYHSFIKQSNKETMALSKASIDPTAEKLVEIKNKILEMMGNIKNLHAQALMATKKHILWMDSNLSDNQEQLQQLENEYKGEFIVRYYTDNKKFRDDVIELKDYPTIIILSAAAADSNIQYGDGDNFQFLKQNKNDLRLRGVVIYCKQRGFDNLKGLMKDESRLLQCITIHSLEMMNAVKNLVIPLNFKRVIPLAHLDAYLSVSAKNTLISFSQNDWSSRSLAELHPDKVNYKDIFKRAKDLISSRGIRMRSELVQKMDNIPEELEKLFQSTESNNDELSKSLMSLYSRESTEIPVYNVLNSTLNIMNEDLIRVMLPVIELFTIALFYYDDSPDSVIKRPVKDSVPIVYDFYRGSTIPDDQFNNDQIKVNNMITLPGFSSFSADKKIAAVFIETNTGFTDSQPVVFNYKYKTGNTFFSNRPKFLDKVTCFRELEYLIYPFTLFRITEVIPPTDEKNYYDIVLSIN